LTYLVEHLDLPSAVGDPDAKWETFQLAHLNNESIFAIDDKCRQAGWSWLSAAEAVANGHNKPRTPHIFVSINQEEAAEKIRYARATIEALDKEARPHLITDNTYELEFDNGSRLISHPCRPPRGKAKAVIYLDEFAHYPKDREIYQAAVPVVSKGGMVRIGSSPLGARGLFWEIFTEAFKKFPGYMRQLIPWWTVRALCKDVKMAARLAPMMETEMRVRAFGTERLVTIYENMLEEDFQQEYECAWLDEAVSWIDWELIKRNQTLAAEERHWYRKVKGVDAAFEAITEVANQVVDARIEQTLVGGMDVGRRKDTTEIILCGTNEYTNSLPYRLHITLDRVEFDQQYAVVEKVLTQLPITNFLIDQTGIGMNIAEKASLYACAQGVDFTNQSKELFAIEIKQRMQRSQVPIPLERDLMYQIHSIRKKITAAKNSVYDTENNEKHHADMFWALALAVWAGKDGYQAVGEGNDPLSGYRG
jgi:phage FluMu gp28-like protein